MFKEFKQFISKGNVLEMAVGLIMALYFGAIVKSLVNDIIMPPIGLMLGGIDFTELKIILQDAVPAMTDPVSGDSIKEAVAEVSLNYGVFINHIITFIVVAFAVFLLVKGYNSLKKKEEEKSAAPPEPTKEEILLTEIRDLLKK